jgi:hypothetical protein
VIVPGAAGVDAGHDSTETVAPLGVGKDMAAQAEPLVVVRATPQGTFRLIVQHSKSVAMDKWPGLPREIIDELAGRYDRAFQVALQQAVAADPDRAKAGLMFIRLQHVVRGFLRTELRGMGCPQSLVPERAKMIENHADKVRARAAILPKGSA